MTALQERQAIPGTTPIREVLGFEERLTSLETENAQLRQMLIEQAACIGMLQGAINTLRMCIRIGASTSLMHNQRLSRLEGSHQGDLRLSDVMAGIEARLARIELGGEGVLP